MPTSKCKGLSECMCDHACGYIFVCKVNEKTGFFFFFFFYASLVSNINFLYVSVLKKNVCIFVCKLRKRSKYFSMQV